VNFVSNPPYEVPGKRHLC